MISNFDESGHYILSSGNINYYDNKLFLTVPNNTLVPTYLYL